LRIPTFQAIGNLMDKFNQQCDILLLHWS
jgi:hypothetical protein